MTPQPVLHLLLLLALPLPAAAQAPDGAVVYGRGAGLQARLGRADGPLLPPGRVTCAGCHGADGLGGAEGGAQPAPPIGWATLAQGTDERPAYDAAGLARLLGAGVTPSGRQISARMPRFEAAPATVAALVAHLQALDAAQRQGLGPDSVALALPRDPGLRAAALAAIAAFNAEGGAWGRRAIVAEPAFLDLDAAAATLLPRLAAAEHARLAQLLRDEPDLRPLPAAAPEPLRVAGTLDQLGPRLPDLLARPGAQAVVVGPASEPMLWALARHGGGAGAHGYAAIRAALDALRDAGRMPTRAGLARRIATADLSALVEVYRQNGAAPMPAQAEPAPNPRGP